MTYKDDGGPLDHAEKLAAFIRHYAFSEWGDASPIAGDEHKADFAVRPTEEEMFVVTVERVKP